MNNRKESDIGSYPEDWELNTVETIKHPESKSIISGPFGSNISAKYFVEDGVPVIRGNNLSLHISERFKDHGFVYITEEKASELNTWATIDDLVFTAVGTIGQVGIISQRLRYSNYIISNKQLRLRVDKNKVLPIFAYYWFASPVMVEQIIQRNTGSSVPLINLSVLKSLQIPIPSLKEQIAITSVLSSLDDKIDLLHRQNHTLEQMAETLFRQWFVEDPDEGWEETNMSNYAEHTKVSIKPNAKPTDIYAHYSIPGFDAGKEPVFETGQEIRSNKYKVYNNTILFSKLNPHKDKRIWLILDDAPKNAICSTEFQVLKPKDENHLYFAYGWISNPINYREIASGVGGTSGSHQRISPSEIFSFHAPKIPSELLNEYADKVKPLYKKQKNNQTQIRALTALRDTLLPKLMSGEVRVKINTTSYVS